MFVPPTSIPITQAGSFEGMTDGTFLSRSGGWKVGVGDIENHEQIIEKLLSWLGACFDAH